MFPDHYQWQREIHPGVGNRQGARRIQGPARNECVCPHKGWHPIPCGDVNCWQQRPARRAVGIRQDDRAFASCYDQRAKPFFSGWSTKLGTVSAQRKRRWSRNWQTNGVFFSGSSGLLDSERLPAMRDSQNYSANSRQCINPSGARPKCYRSQTAFGGREQPAPGESLANQKLSEPSPGRESAQLALYPDSLQRKRAILSFCWRGSQTVGRALQMRVFSHVANRRNGRTVIAVFGIKKEIPA